MHTLHAELAAEAVNFTRAVRDVLLAPSLCKNATHTAALYNPLPKPTYLMEDEEVDGLDVEAGFQAVEEQYTTRYGQVAWREVRAAEPVVPAV